MRRAALALLVTAALANKQGKRGSPRRPLAQRRAAPKTTRRVAVPHDAPERTLSAAKAAPAHEARRALDP